MSFTQPICERCWIKRNSDERSIRRPHLVKDPDPERCCWCGLWTIWGGYIREDPNAVPYPTKH